MIGATAVAVLFSASLAAAQAPQMVRVRATIDSVDGQTLAAKARDGTMMKVQLAPNAPVNQIVTYGISIR